MMNKTIGSFEKEGIKTIIAELVVQTEGILKRLEENINFVLPDMIDDEDESRSDIKRHLHVIDYDIVAELVRLNELVKSANYGTMTLETAERLYSPNDYRW